MVFLNISFNITYSQDYYLGTSVNMSKIMTNMSMAAVLTYIGPCVFLLRASDVICVHSQLSGHFHSLGVKRPHLGYNKQLIEWKQLCTAVNTTTKTMFPHSYLYRHYCPALYLPAKSDGDIMFFLQLIIKT